MGDQAPACFAQIARFFKGGNDTSQLQKGNDEVQNLTPSASAQIIQAVNWMQGRF